MAKLRERLIETWTAWNIETTPEIFVAVTAFGAFVFSALAVAFSALAVAAWLQESESPSILGPVLLFAPPSIVTVLWVTYRVVWFRRLFRTPGGT